MSPLNEDAASLSKLCAALAPQEMIFDPQCFSMGSTKGGFSNWPYVQRAAKTVSRGRMSLADAQLLAVEIANACIPLGHHGVCSPAPCRKSFADADLGFDIQVGNALAAHLKNSPTYGLQTAVFPTSKLVGAGRVPTIASILTTGRLERLYIVPEWAKAGGELEDANELSGFIQLVNSLSPHREFVIGFCGPEMILWKAAGATDVASGKYSNQQRFDLARFGGAASRGRGTTAYYFEESLLTWLRTEDIVRLDRLGYKLGLTNDPYFPQIRKRIAALQATPPKRVAVVDRNGKPVIDKNTGKPKTKRIGPPDWTSLGWAQWLWWFADAEARLQNGGTTARGMVDAAQTNWARLRVAHFIPTDKVSDGRCLPAWSAALKSIGL